MCPSCRLPGSVSATHGEQQHPQVFPRCLEQEDKAGVVQSSAPLCRAMLLPVLLHPKTTQTLRQEVPPQVTVHWNRTSRHSAGQGVEGLCVCVCVHVCVCMHFLSQKSAFSVK